MSSTSQLTTFSDLYTDLLNRVRSDTSQTATSTQAKRYINIALQDMHLGFDYRFPWAERSAILLTQAQYDTGTVTITQGSTTLTGSGTAWNTANAFSVNNMRANGKVRIAGSRQPYIVSSVFSDTAATLSSKFVESDVSAETYLYYEDEYDLAADFLRPVDAQSFSDECSISIISRTEFRRRFPTNSTTGRPSVACINDYAPSGNTTPIRRVQFSNAPSTAMRIPYAYITSYLAVTSSGTAQAQLSGDTDEPIVPLRYRHAIVFHALHHWYRDKKDDSRSGEAKSEYTDIMLRASADVEVGGKRPQFQPRSGVYANRARRPWRGGGGRYDINGRFDRLE